MAAPTGSAGLSVFTRNATGLVREVGVWDQFLFLLFVVNLGLGPILVFEVGPAATPNGSLIWGIILGGIGYIALGVVYALFTSTMPRTGGDYIFLTRLVSPAVGFVGSWMLVITFVTVGTAGAAYFWGHFVVPFAFYGFSKAFGNNVGLMNLSTWLASTTGSSIMAAVLILIGSAILVSGMRVYVLQQRLSFILGMIGVVAGLIVLGVVSQSTFAHHFNSVAGAGMRFNAVPRYAHAAGLAPYHLSFAQTIGTFAMVMQALSFCVATTWFAGELKGVRQVKNTIWTMAGSCLVMIVYVVILGLLLDHLVGRDWLNSIVYLYTHGSKHYTLPWDPNYGFLTVIATSSPIVLFLIGIGFLFWSAQWVFMNMLWPVRLLFAWSFDRLVPERLSEVNDRTHTPVLAIVLVTIIGLISLYLAQTGQIIGYFLAGAFLESLLFTVVAFVGIIYPFTRRESYRNSPANIQVVGIPLITIAGVLAFVVSIIADWEFIVLSGYGVNARGPMTWSIATIASGIIVYYGLNAWNRLRGVDLSLVYNQIPPE